MRRDVIILVLALVLAPFSADAADLIVWWEQGFYPQADEAVAEIVAAFEQKTGKRVELIQPTQDELFDKAQAALEAGQPPDFLFGTTSEGWAAQWAYDGQLTDLAGTLRPVLKLFDPDVVEASTLLNGKTGRRASSPRRAGSPTGWTSPATSSCRPYASSSSGRSGWTRATRTAHAAVQILSRPHYDPTLGVRNKEWRSPPIFEENVWGTAVHRVVTEGITPEQAVGEAIARIKQILSE